MSKWKETNKGWERIVDSEPDRWVLGYRFTDGYVANLARQAGFMDPGSSDQEVQESIRQHLTRRQVENIKDYPKEGLHQLDFAWEEDGQAFQSVVIEKKDEGITVSIPRETEDFDEMRGLVVDRYNGNGIPEDRLSEISVSFQLSNS